MKTKVGGILVAALLLAACAREPANSDGNGTGKADGALGREDPVTAPATDGQPAAPAQSDDASSNPPPQPSQQ